MVKQAPKHWQYGGVPLFWRESKTQEFWKHILEAFDIMAVVDLTPGSGALVVESMRRGAQYLRVCNHPTHLTWLQNAIDREALSLISESGTPCSIKSWQSTSRAITRTSLMSSRARRSCRTWRPRTWMRVVSREQARGEIGFPASQQLVLKWQVRGMSRTAMS